MWCADEVVLDAAWGLGEAIVGSNRSSGPIDELPAERAVGLLGELVVMKE